MIPPKGFKNEIYPLRHYFEYSYGLSYATGSLNSTIMQFVKNYKSVNNPDTINVNPHHASFKRETGPICAPMSIIDKLSLSMHFTLTEQSITDGMKSLKLKIMPIFMSFPEKLDSSDEFTSNTGAGILELLKDATEEDIIPLWDTNLPAGSGGSEKVHPTSSVNFTEVFGTIGLSVDTAMESVDWNDAMFHDALKYYTNKGAIRAMVGRTRNIFLTDSRPSKSIYIRKFVPRAVRRIMPYSWFGMLVHVPIVADATQTWLEGAATASKANVGVKCIVNYHEWNSDHLQEMM